MKTIIKKFTTLTLTVAALVICTLGTKAQTTLFTEDFESAAIGQSPPSGWAITPVVGSNHISFVSSGEAPTCSPASGSRMVEFNSYSAPKGDETRLRMTTPVSTIGKTTIMVDFKWRIDKEYLTMEDYVNVQYSLNGTTWTTAGTASRPGSTNAWVTQTVALPAAAAGQATLYIAFDFVSDYGNNCHLDLVHILSCGPLAPSTHTVGSGTSTSNYPYLTYWMGARTQLLYNASDIRAAGGVPGMITSVGFNIATASAQTMQNFNLRLANTSLTSFSGWATGMTTCYSGSYSVPGTGWQMITLQTPFYWDGSNVILEICYGSNGSFTTNTTVYGSSVAADRIQSYWNDNLTGCSFTGTPYAGNTSLPNLRFSEQPHSGALLGRICNSFNQLGQGGVTVNCGTQNATTNAAGTYVFYNLPVGIYTVNCTSAGFYSTTFPATITNAASSVKNACMDPIYATIQGVVTSSITGNPVVGATIRVNNQSTVTTGPGGQYSLYFYSFDPFTILVDKAGFNQGSKGPLNFVYGSTTTHNIALTEAPNPPDAPTAVLNASQSAVNISWGVPKGLYELLYDDGIMETLAQWPATGNYNAVKFTPVAYPCSLQSVNFNIGQPGNYPAGSNPLKTFQFLIFDATGPGGTPGNQIAGPFTVGPYKYGWIMGSCYPYPTITSGSFYVVHQQGGNAPNAAGLGVDNTTNQLRSYQKSMPSGTWTQVAGNFLMRATVKGTGGPLPLLPVQPGTGMTGDSSDSPGNLTGYQVFRFLLGQEGTPASWVPVGTTSSLTLADNSWPALPCNPYRWAVKALYTNGNTSYGEFTNPVGKCWTAPVTVNVSLNACAGATLAGTFIQLQNNEYPDTLYQVALGAVGTHTFPTVFKGNYTLSVVKYGYSAYSSSPIGISGVYTANVTLQPILNPPSNLSVDPHTLKATWNPPDFSSAVFTEDWSGGSFSSNNWIPEGGTNWSVTSFSGNAAPSLIFQSFPAATNYNVSLNSSDITGLHSSILKLKYDIYLLNQSAPGTNFLNVEIWNGAAWVVLKSYTTSANIPWTTESTDISAYTHKTFKIRFHAYGANTASLGNWKVDNIKVVADDPGLATCMNGYNFYLDGALVAVPNTTTNTIPPSYSFYGQDVTACVNAGYATGNSTNACTAFTDKYLCNPSNLAVSDAGSTASLSWTKPFCDPVNPNCFVYDDASMEDAWMAFPGTVLWYGNKMNVGSAQSGQLTSVKMKWWNSQYATDPQSLQVDIFSLAGVLLGSTPVFTVPVPAPAGYMEVNFTTPVNYSGPFYCMVKWNNLPSYTHYLGYDQNGPNAMAGLDFVFDGTVFTPTTVYWLGQSTPGVFCLLACGTASMDGPVEVISPSPGPLEGTARGPEGPAPCLSNGLDLPEPAPGQVLPGESDSPLSDASLIGYNIYMASDSAGPYTLAKYSEGADILTTSITGLSAGVHWFRLTGYYDLGPIGFPGSFDESAPTEPKAAYIGIIPYNQNVSNLVVSNGQAFCYDALNILTFAGSGKYFVVATGGSASMVAGQKISYLYGTTVQAGGYLHGTITTSGQYCSPGKSLTGLPADGDAPDTGGSSETSLFKAYPNPTRGDVTVELNGEITSGDTRLEVFSPMGERVATQKLNGEKKALVSLENRVPGIYFIRVSDGSRTATAKIVLQP